ASAICFAIGSASSSGRAPRAIRRDRSSPSTSSMMMARTPPRLLEAVDVRNVGMVQRGERLGFPGESGKAVRISGKGVGQDLQRDIAIELRIAGPKHLPHSPFADRRGDVVAAKSGARRKGQVLGLNGPGGAGMQIVGKRSMCGNASASKAAQPARPRL